MTRKELSQLYWLKREIENNKKHLAELEAKATEMSPSLEGLPHAPGIADKTAIAADIADVRAVIAAQEAAARAEYIRLIRYIATVDDSLMRQILTLRYIEGLSWPMVAARIGGGNTEGSVRMAHNRYLKNH